MITSATEKENLLRLSPYDPKYFWQIDWKLLFADISFILFGILISNHLFDGSDITFKISPRILLCIYLLVSVIICWYMGFILARYRVYYNRKVNRIATWVFTIVGLTIVGMLVVLTNPLLDSENFNDDNVDRFSLFAIFMMIISPIFGLAGFTTGKKAIRTANAGEFPNPKEKGKDEIVYSVLFAFFFGIAFMMIAGSTDFVLKSSYSFLLTILVFIAGGLVSAISFIVMGWSKVLLIKIGIYYRLAFVFEIIFPFIIISSFILWNEIHKHFYAGYSGLGTFGILFFTGILPFRILLIFNPPLRASNLIIGIGAFVFYVWSLF